MSLNYIKDQTLRWGYRVAIKASPSQTSSEVFEAISSFFDNGVYEFTHRNSASGSPEITKVKLFNLESAEETGYDGNADYLLTLVQVI